MEIQEIILSLIKVDLTELNKEVDMLFAELQTEYNNSTSQLENCKHFMDVLEICKRISLRADAMQEMSKAVELFDKFLKDTGINTEDFEDDDD